MSWKWGRGERGIVWRRLMVLSFPRAASLQLLLLAAPSPQKTISLKDFTSETSILSRPLFPFICAVWPFLEHSLIVVMAPRGYFSKHKACKFKTTDGHLFHGLNHFLNHPVPNMLTFVLHISVESVYHEADMIGLAVHLRISIISSKLFSIARERRLLEKK